jgi:hypothetical protein
MSQVKRDEGGQGPFLQGESGLRRCAVKTAGCVRRLSGTRIDVPQLIYLPHVAAIHYCLPFRY